MKKVYFNHDGGVDDLISLFLLIHMEDIDLIGVSAIGADSYIEPATSASQKIVNRFSKTPIHIAASKERGKNPFPKDWRMNAFFMDSLHILNEQLHQYTQLISYSSYEYNNIKMTICNDKEKLQYN